MDFPDGIFVAAAFLTWDWNSTFGMYRNGYWLQDIRAAQHKYSRNIRCSKNITSKVASTRYIWQIQQYPLPHVFIILIPIVYISKTTRTTATAAVAAASNHYSSSIVVSFFQFSFNCQLDVITIELQWFSGRSIQSIQIVLITLFVFGAIYRQTGILFIYGHMITKLYKL